MIHEKTNTPATATVGPEPVIQLQGLSKSYGSVHAVSNLDLVVHAGEFVSLLGPSGCGKTTTLRMVAGFVAPTSGNILIGGTDTTHLPPNQRDTGMVFQSYALFPHMTVHENVSFGLENLNVKRREREQRVAEMLKIVDLTGFERRRPKELSGGQQQRVALARALVIEPQVLLLDEPFSNLDTQLRVRLREELKSVVDRVGVTTLFVTHDQDEALMLSDRIVVMNQGRAAQIGTPGEIYEQPANRFVAGFLGHCNLLKGKIRGGSFISDGGLELPIDGPDGSAEVAIRPEYITILEPSASDNTAVVETCQYLGSICRLTVKVQNERLTLEQHFMKSNLPKPGDALSLNIDARFAARLEDTT